MKTLNRLTIVTVTAVVAMTGAFAQSSDNTQVAQIVPYQKNMHAKHRKGYMRALFKQLNLTEAQKEQMKALRQEMKAQHKERKSAMIKGRGMAQIGRYVSANGFDKQAFIAMATKRSQAMIQRRADMFEKSMNILTPKQRIKFVQLLEEKAK
jgi:Spy/CpxP family protein refolding chaperone